MRTVCVPASQTALRERALPVDGSCTSSPVSGSILEISGNAQSFSLRLMTGGAPPAGCHELAGNFGTTSLPLGLPVIVVKLELRPEASTAAMSNLNSLSGGRYSI